MENYNEKLNEVSREIALSLITCEQQRDENNEVLNAIATLLDTIESVENPESRVVNGKYLYVDVVNNGIQISTPALDKRIGILNISFSAPESKS